MELQYHGANCIRIITKKSQLITDPKSDITSIKPDLKKVNYILATQPAYLPEPIEDRFIVDMPGEFEFTDCSVKAVAAQAHTAPSGDTSATIFRLTAADVTVVVVGHVAGQLSELQLEDIGVVDIVVVPVGGGGYTLDGLEAASVVRALEPKMVVPVHYAHSGVTYEVPQGELDLFVKELGAPLAEAVEKYKVKFLPDLLTVQPLVRL